MTIEVVQHPVSYFKYLIFKLRWIMLDKDEQCDVYAQVHMDINGPHWDNYEQFRAAQDRGDDYLPTWQDLSAYIRGES